MSSIKLRRIISHKVKDERLKTQQLDTLIQIHKSFSWIKTQVIIFCGFQF